MRYRFTLFLFTATLPAVPAALAQAIPAYDLSATHRSVQATQLWPQLQGEWMPDSSNYLLLGVQVRRFLGDDGQSLGIGARQVQLGYEHAASQRWSFGTTACLYGDGGARVFIPEALLRHRSPVLGGYTFGQRLSVERTFGSTQALESGPAGQYWGRLRVEVERLYPLGRAGLALRPRLSYEAATHLRLQKTDNDPDERTIQYTSLRGEVGLRVAAAFDLTPWFAYQTRYLDTLPQYDQSGMPTAGGKVNTVFPTFGLDLRYTLLPAGRQRASRRQLPTQH